MLFFGFALLAGCQSVSRHSGEKQKQQAQQKRPAPTPAPTLSAETYYQRGVQALQSKNHKKALEDFRNAEVLWAGNARESDAVWGVLRSSVRSQNYDETIRSGNRLKSLGKWSANAHLEIHNDLVRAFEADQKTIEVLREDDLAVKNSSLSTSDHENFRQKSIEIIQSKLTLDQLKNIVGEIQDPLTRAYFWFRLAELELENKNIPESRSYFSRASQDGGSSDIGKEALIRLEQLEALRKVEVKTIGAVLPLSGKNSNVGQRTLRGLQMGLGIHQNSQFELAVVDVDSQPDLARSAVEKLIKEDHVITVVGSLSSRSAQTVASKTAEFGVPNLSLSQKSELTELGPTVFRNALTSEMQVRTLVRKAMSDWGLKRFAILFPNDAYGVEFANLFWDEVLARGGVITGAQAYSPQETDFRAAIQRLVGTFYFEDRSDEYKMRFKLWSESQGKKTARTNPPEDLLPPHVDFDALFVPDSSKSMGQISAMLTNFGVKTPKLLGTNLLNTDGLSKRMASWGGNIYFVDGVSEQDIKNNNSSFFSEYRNLFKEEPGPFEIQGYESGLLLRQLILQGANSRESLRQALENVRNIPGPMGLLSMSPEREIAKPLTVLTLESGEIRAQKNN